MAPVSGGKREEKKGVKMNQSKGVSRQVYFGSTGGQGGEHKRGKKEKTCRDSHQRKCVLSR